MKIIIAGAGAVGTHLAKLLSNENQNITVIDESPEKTEALTQAGNYDLITFNTAPTSIMGMKEAGVAQADLFIAVTPEETRNITCCMLAHALGAKKTVARVDNSEYMQRQHQEFFRQMGIDSLIYPEQLAAVEILDGLKRSWARQYWEVHGGALVMLGVKLRETAKILNQALYQLCPPDAPYHVVAIKRAAETLIPNGRSELQLGDIAYFMTTKKYIPYIRELVGKEHYADVKNVLVMGGGRTCVHVAHMKPDYMSMKIIEQNIERCNRLNELLEDDDIMVIQGDGRDTSLLLDEGIRDTQAFCALSPETETNILACLAAKRLGVRKTVALCENMDYVDMAEKLDIGTIINKKTIAASHIYQMMLNADVNNVKCLNIANADVAEFIAAEEAPITSRPIRDIKLPEGCTFGGLVRNGVGMPINGNTQIQAGDSVVVFCRSQVIKKLDPLFRKQSGGLLAKIGIK
ncbi:MAG: Trk system potassium transporter TrkA [Bacteroidales bacterium]|nr:Trk system potassium transporter TrkA [Candidatus Physcousia equi]